MKGMKKAISVTLTVLMTAAMAATVYAVDYATIAPTPAATTTSFKPASRGLTSSISNDTPAIASVSTTDVQDAIKEVVSGGISGTATVEVNSTAVLPVSSAAIKALKSSKDGVLEIKAPKATISIDAATVKKVAKVDLSSKIYGSDKRMVVDFRASANKAFGCEVKVTLTSCKMSAAKLASAQLYRDGEAVDGLEINENGQPVITVTTGGTYEIK